MEKKKVPARRPFRKKRKREEWWYKGKPKRGWAYASAAPNMGHARIAQRKFSRDSKEYRKLRQDLWDRGIRDSRKVAAEVVKYYGKRFRKRVHHWVMQLRAQGVSIPDAAVIIGIKEGCDKPRSKFYIDKIIAEGKQEGWPQLDQYIGKPRPDWVDDL